MSGTVQSYIKSGDQFTMIASFSGPIKDLDYIEGVIELTVNGVALMTIDHVDLVDQLWVYFIDALTNVARGEDRHFYFPDQPLKVDIRNLPANACLLTVDDVSVRIGRMELIRLIAEGAIVFFQEIRRLVPNSDVTWKRYLAEAQDLLQLARGSEHQ